MARAGARLPENATGDFYVDRSCIDCDACRRIAPAIFAEGDGHSFVGRQPRDDAERRAAAMALVACPTASIGTLSAASRGAIAEAASAFPDPIEDGIFACGYTSERSFGAFAYLIRRPEGNVLVDSPRAARPLLKRIEAMGGVRLMFLTHRDDVADHASFRRRFGCDRILHEDDVTRSTAGVERRPGGVDPIPLAPDLLMIPSPGHTRGHAVLLLGATHLFTGDHLAWSPEEERLVAFHDACWYSWTEQIRSMERLLDHRFEAIHPGHGRPWRAPSPERMRREVERCVAWMRSLPS